MRHRRIFYLIFFVASNAIAHPFDVSKSESTVEGRTVHGHMEVAMRDLQGKTLDTLVSEQTQVTLGSAPCSKPAITRSWMEGEDGAAVDFVCMCPSEGELAVGMYWLKEMPAEHRHVAHLSFGKNGLTAMLTSEHPTASFAPPPKPPVSVPPPTTRWPWYASGAVLGLLILAGYKRLVSRRDTQK